MTNSPRVSVIMNCFNGEKYLREAIDSVMAQSFKDWEIVFWDNQSTDKSADIFHSYKDSRLRYYYAPSHRLLYDARNYAINQAKGEIIAFLDVDDWWLPNKLEKQVTLFSDPNVGVVCGNFYVLSEKKNKHWKSIKRSIPTGYVLNESLKSYKVGLLTLMVRLSALKDLGYACNPNYRLIGDFDLVIRLLVKWKLDYIHEPVGYYRMHESNESLKHIDAHTYEIEQWIDDMSNIKEISSSFNFSFVKNKTKYIHAINLLLKSDKKSALQIFYKLPWGALKIRLVLAILLPIGLFRRMKIK